MAPALDGLSDGSPESTTATSEHPIQKSFSCVLCAQRKVKCDRCPGGCDNCTKARVSCIYKAPLPPRRRKKGVRDVDTTTRLRLYEDALHQMGVDPEELVRQNSTKGLLRQSILNHDGSLTRSPHSSQDYAPPETGVLVSDDWWKSRYLENGLWTTLKGEFRDSEEILEASSDDESPEAEERLPPSIWTPNSATLLFPDIRVRSSDLRSLHPQPAQLYKLWQFYLDNISPLIKLFHAPSIQHFISNASGNMEDIPRNVEALMFGIYCVTIESLSDRECIDILGESKSIARQKFRTGAQHALANVGVLKTSEMMVLKAFVLFVVSLQDYDARILWIYSGIARRIAQRIGLHRDGELLNIPPFQTEMRRRLWWQVMLLEGYSQKLAGAGTSVAVTMGDVKLPSNLNDSDLFEGMKELPKEHEGATEMMFFLIRIEVGEFLKRFNEGGAATFDGAWNRLTTKSLPLSVKDKAIDDLEALLHRKYLDYCDPSITWHLMCSHLGKGIISMMRFMAHSPEYYSGNISQSEKDLLFVLALQVAASQNLAYIMKEMQGFIWHINMHFQWKAFIYILSELRSRTRGSQVEIAWKEIEKTFDYHPSFEQELSRRALPIAVSNLTLKAWKAYIADQGIPASGEPYFIQLIRRRQNRTKSPSSSTKQSEAVQTPSTQAYETQHSKVNNNGNFPVVADPLQSFDWSSMDFSADMGIDSILPEMLLLDHPEQMNWSSWDSLLADFQTNDVNESPIDLSTFNFGIQ